MLDSTQLRDELFETKSKLKIRDLDFAKLKGDYKVIMKQLSRRSSDPNQQDTHVVKVFFNK